MACGCRAPKRIERQPLPEVLQPKDIQGQWHNLVNLSPQITTDDAQKQTLGLHGPGGIISKRTFRDKIMTMAFPSDEQERIETEKALESPQMQPKVMLRAVQSYFPDTWQEVIKATPFEQVAMQDDAPRGNTPLGCRPVDLVDRRRA